MTIPIPLNIPGISHPLCLSVYHEKDTCISRQIIDHGIWEPYETSLVVKDLKRGDVFLDIGANLGYYTIIAGSIVGIPGKVLAFEPDLNNFNMLKKNIRLNKLSNVTAVNAAVSDVGGKGYIYLSDDNKGDHHIYDCGGSRKRVKIDILAGDKFIAKETDRVNFIKIDTQGSEVRILRGLASQIQENRANLSMVIEFWPYGLRQSGTSALDLTDIINHFNLPICVIDHIGHRLFPVTVADLEKWVNETESDPMNQGFMNLFLSSKLS